MATATTTKPVGVRVAQEVERSATPGTRRRRAPRPTRAPATAPCRSACTRPVRRWSASSRSTGFSVTSVIADPPATVLAHDGADAGSGRDAAAPPSDAAVPASCWASSLRCPSRTCSSGCRDRPCMYSIIAGPEAALPDLGRHEVRGVETAGALLQRVGQDHGRVGQDVVGIAVRTDVRRSARCATTPARRPSRTAPCSSMNWSRKSIDLGPVAVLADDRELTGVQRALLVDRREREPVVVDAGLRPLRGRSALMKLACRCSQHFGGFSNIGSGASPNAMSGVAAAPPST